MGIMCGWPDKEVKKVKYKIVWIRYADTGGIPFAHYEICTDEKEPKNLACLDTTKEGIKIIRKMIKLYNDSLPAKKACRKVKDGK